MELVSFILIGGHAGQGYVMDQSCTGPDPQLVLSANMCCGRSAQQWRNMEPTLDPSSRTTSSVDWQCFV